MNKRITSILLCFIMLFSMLVSAVPVYATTYESTQLKVVPDKTTANPGDIITYTIVMGPVSDMGSMQMVLDIPTGLTYVENSGKLADGLRTALGFDVADWTEVSKMVNGFASAADYECDTDTTLATFQCKVNDGFTGTVSVGLKNLEFGSCQTFDYHTNRFSVAPTAVTIEAKPVAVTGVTIDETLSVKTGESKTPSYTVNPAEATNKAVTFTSNNTAVASVNATTGEVTGVTEGTATITITTADGNFTDTCVVTVSPTTYTVTVTNGSGSGDYTEGANVTITANAPEIGKQFKEWTGADNLTFTSGSKTTATATFTMPAEAVTVTATYEDIPQQPTTYTVTVTNGSGSGDYTEGANVTITANAAPQGKVFDKWEVTGATVADVNSATTSFTMPANAVTATATYKDVPQQPTATLTDIKITTPPTKTTYTAGESFDPTGMVVTAYYSDQSSRPLSDDEYTYAPAGALTANDTKITVTYDDDLGTIKTAEQPITVATSITIEIPVRKEIDSNATFSGSETFTFEVEVLNSNVEMEALAITGNSVTVTSNNGGSTTISIAVPADTIDDFYDEGIKITEKAGNAAGWTYSTEEYYVAFDASNGYTPTYSLDNPATSYVREVVFTNSYAPVGNRPPLNPPYNPAPGSTGGSFTAAKTFDGGIGFSVAVTILSAAGGAWLAKKKED